MNKFLVVLLVVLVVSASVDAAKKRRRRKGGKVGKVGTGPTGYANKITGNALDNAKGIVNDATHGNIPGVVQKSFKTAQDAVRDTLGGGLGNIAGGAGKGLLGGK